MNRVAAAVVIVAALAAGAAGAASPPTVVAKIRVPAGTQPCAAFKGGRFVWVSLFRGGSVLRIDPVTN